MLNTSVPYQLWANILLNCITIGPYEMAFEIGKYLIVHTHFILLSHLDYLFCHLDNTDNYSLTFLNLILGSKCYTL